MRPGWRSSSSRRPGHGAWTFCTTAPVSSGSSALATSRSSLGLSDRCASPKSETARRVAEPSDSPGGESERYLLFEVFRFAFRAAGLFFAVFLFFFGAISASLRGECSSLGPSEWSEW